MTRIRTILIPIVSVIVIYASVVVGYNIPRTTHSDPPKPTQEAQMPDDYKMWELTNKARTDNGKKQLALDPKLIASAIDKCVDMVQQKYWDHTAPNGNTYKDFILTYVPDTTWAGENLSIGYSTSESVFNAWMNSPGHKANILNENYTTVGFSECTNAKSQIMVVQHFAN